jgi:dolichyl-phosphate beta-glucosyltransferase
VNYPCESISLILPAFNEASRIAGTIDEAIRYFESRQYAYEIIVAADGHDGTREIVKQLGRVNPFVRVIGEPIRRGKGRSIREAALLATHSVIGFADADNKVPIAEYDKVAPFLAAGCPIVIGSRALEKSIVERKQPWYRRLGAKGFRVFMRTVTGLRTISDTQCGFKFFQRDVAHQIFTLQKTDGYMFDVEILLLAECLGLRVHEVPIRWRDDGDTRLQLLRGNLHNVRDIFRIRGEMRHVAQRLSRRCHTNDCESGRAEKVHESSPRATENRPTAATRSKAPSPRP